MTWQYIILHYITLHTNIHTASYRHLTNIYVKRNRSVDKEIAPPPWPVLWWRCGDDAGMTLRLIVKPHWNCEPRRQHPDFRATKRPILANHKDFSAGHGTSVVHSGFILRPGTKIPQQTFLIRLFSRASWWFCPTSSTGRAVARNAWSRFSYGLATVSCGTFRPIEPSFFLIGTSFHILYINMLYIYVCV